MARKKKSLGQIAYEQWAGFRYLKAVPNIWFDLSPSYRNDWETIAAAVEREVLRRLKVDGELGDRINAFLDEKLPKAKKGNQ